MAVETLVYDNLCITEVQARKKPGFLVRPLSDTTVSEAGTDHAGNHCGPFLCPAFQSVSILALARAVHLRAPDDWKGQPVETQM
jgi:hypothetical protein